MIELQKILVYLVTTILLFYMVKLLIFTKKDGNLEHTLLLY